MSLPDFVRHFTRRWTRDEVQYDGKYGASFKSTINIELLFDESIVLMKRVHTRLFVDLQKPLKIALTSKIDHRQMPKRRSAKNNDSNLLLHYYGIASAAASTTGTSKLHKTRKTADEKRAIIFVDVSYGKNISAVEGDD